MDHGYREQQCFNILFPLLSSFNLTICYWNHASMHCAKGMHICMHPPPCSFGLDRYASTDALLLLSGIDYPPLHSNRLLCSRKTQRRGMDTRKIFLPCFSQSLLTFTFFDLALHTYMYSHIHTHKAHTACPGHPAHPLSGKLHGQRGQDSPY